METEANNKGGFSYYANNTRSGIYDSYVWEYLPDQNYKFGRKRDLVLFAITDSSNNTLLMDSLDNPRMAVAVCNPTKQKSGKSKLVKLRRALLTPEHNISLLESFKFLPSINDFCFSKDFKGSTYKIKVEQKINNGNIISLVREVFSELLNAFVSIDGVFDSKGKQD